MCAYSVAMDHYLNKPRDWWSPEKMYDAADLAKIIKEYDRVSGQPDCELDAKKAALKEIADQLGVNVEFP